MNGESFSWGDAMVMQGGPVPTGSLIKPGGRDADSSADSAPLGSGPAVNRLALLSPTRPVAEAQRLLSALPGGHNSLNKITQGLLADQLPDTAIEALHSALVAFNKTVSQTLSGGTETPSGPASSLPGLSNLPGPTGQNAPNRVATPNSVFRGPNTVVVRPVVRPVG